MTGTCSEIAKQSGMQRSQWTRLKSCALAYLVTPIVHVAALAAHASSAGIGKYLPSVDGTMSCQLHCVCALSHGHGSSLFTDSDVPPEETLSHQDVISDVIWANLVQRLSATPVQPAAIHDETLAHASYAYFRNQSAFFRGRKTM